MNKLITNISFLTVAPILGYTIQFLVLPIIILDIGIGSWGKWNIGIAYSSIGLFLSDYGASTGFIARMNEGRAKEELIRMALPNRLLFTSVSCFLILVFFILYGETFFLSGLVILLSGLLNFDSVLLFENRSKYIAIRELMSKIITILLLLFLKYYFGKISSIILFTAFLAGGLFSFCFNLYLFRIFVLSIKRRDFSHLTKFWIEFSSDMTNSISQLIQARAPIIIINMFGGVGLAGSWSVIEGLGRAVLTPFGIIGHSLFATVKLSRAQIINFGRLKLVMISLGLGSIILICFVAIKPLLEHYFHLTWSDSRYIVYFLFVTFAGLILVLYNVIFSNYYSIRLTNYSSLMAFVPATVTLLILLTIHIDVWLSMALSLVIYELSKPLIVYLWHENN